MKLYNILFEIDLKDVKPSLMGIYAFYLAYNKLVGKVFRSPLKLEFETNNLPKPVFKNKTLYINPHIELSRTNKTCFNGACHDMLHMITQNIVETFGKFKKKSSEEKKEAAPANEIVVSLKYYDAVLKILDTIGIPYNKEEFSIKSVYEKFSSVSLRNPPKTKLDKQEIISKILRGNLATLKYQKNQKWAILSAELDILLNLLLDYSGKNYYEIISVDPEKLSRLSKDELIKFSTSNLGNENNSEPLKTNNTTHAMEEMVGNVFSDNFREALENSEQIDVKSFMDFFKADFDTINIENSDSVEFPIGQNQLETARKQKSKWKEYLLMVLPLFLNEYNRQLQILKGSKFGSNV